MNNYDPFANNQSPPLNQFTQSRPLNTKIDNPEIEYIQKMQRNSILWHLVSILLVFIASAVIHTYAILVVFGAVGIWLSTSVAVHFMPNEERQNIKKTRLWVIGYSSVAILFDVIVTNLSSNVAGYGMDAAAMQFLSYFRLILFLGVPIMNIGITLKRLHFNWEVKNNEEKTASYMRQNTKKSLRK